MNYKDCIYSTQIFFIPKNICGPVYYKILFFNLLINLKPKKNDRGKN